MKKLFFLLGLVILLSGCKTKQTFKEEVKEFKGDLKQAMQLGVPMKCEWSQNEDKGTSYVKGKEAYIEMTVQGKTGYIIQKDNCIWTWSDDQKDGVKICSEKTEEESVIQPETDSFKAKGVNFDVEYECAPALFDSKKFDPPNEIKFMDIGSMMQNLPSIPSIPPQTSEEE